MQVDKIFNEVKRYPTEISKKMEKQITKQEVDFWSRAAITADITKCWEWLKPTNGDYGRLRWDGRRSLAHRIAYQLYTKRVPSKLVLHHCDNRPCINPHHLYEGTHFENTRDCFERNPDSLVQIKLSEEDIPKIFALRKRGMLHREIAEQFNVGLGAIAHVLKRVSWQHVHNVPEVVINRRRRKNEPPFPCKIDDCERPAYGHRMCKMHYMRAVRSGALESVAIKRKPSG